MVAGCHKTDVPSSLTYSSILSCYYVHIDFKIAALNYLKVPGCDIHNAYLTAPPQNKVWTRAGVEFGSKKGKIMLIVTALYGLKLSGPAFRAFLAVTLNSIGYRPLYSFLFDRSPFSHIVLIIGWWISNPRTEAT